MKIVFIKDVPKVGQRGQIKEVADGYGNSLISRNLAERATESILIKLENKKIENEKKKELKKENFKNFLEKINKEDVVVKIKANEKGHLFKAVSKEDVLTELLNKTGIDIDENWLDVGHIKNTGEYTIKFDDRVNKGECKIKIQAL